ncbi:hypothetical protein EV401DRAFT_1950020 [Pisolithus croceorrhizus]|nr:hypothetical protein EV401DRAFT_1950020 [Pisolithus croceorrhizus]
MTRWSTSRTSCGPVYMVGPPTMYAHNSRNDWWTSRRVKRTPLIFLETPVHWALLIYRLHSLLFRRYVALPQPLVCLFRYRSKYPTWFHMLEALSLSPADSTLLQRVSDMMRRAYFIAPGLQLSGITSVYDMTCRCRPSRSCPDLNLTDVSKYDHGGLSSLVPLYPRHPYTTAIIACVIPSQLAEFSLRRKMEKIKCGIELISCTICPTSTYNTYAYIHSLHVQVKPVLFYSPAVVAIRCFSACDVLPRPVAVRRNCSGAETGPSARHRSPVCVI